MEKFLRDATCLSVVDGRRAHAEGRVRVYLPGASEPSAVRVDDLIYEEDTVLLDEERLRVREHYESLIFHKPIRVTCTLRDPRRQRDLTEFLGAMPPGVFPVGRLDRETTGLLLCTNDGDLAQAILRPEHKTNKVYWLWLDEYVPDGDPRLSQMLAGVPLGEHLARAVAVEILYRTEAYTELLVTLNEGKNRQIRRMCYALDLRLQHLHRKSIGNLEVAALPVGTFRHLTKAEGVTLWEATGGEERVVQRKLEALRRRAREQRQRGTPETRLEAWLKRFENARCRR